jgi:catechol 2,3-dioxygenase-like lactoylglutathione lyase family enzyme
VTPATPMVELPVTDVERSTEFYRELGLEVTRREEVEGWLLRTELGGVLALTLAPEPVHVHGDGVRVLVPGPEERTLADPDGYPVIVAPRG